jgi:hypothetical protein
VVGRRIKKKTMGMLTITIKGGIERRRVTTESYEGGERRREGMDPTAAKREALFIRKARRRQGRFELKARKKESSGVNNNGDRNGLATLSLILYFIPKSSVKKELSHGSRLDYSLLTE